MPHRRKMRRRNREHGSWNDNYGPCMSIFGEGYPIDRMSAYRYNNKKKWKGGKRFVTLQAYLDRRNISRYQLSKISGVPNTTILDICAGRSSLERCSAKTIQQLAKALNCSMEDIMALSEERDGNRASRTGQLPECGLPPFYRNPCGQWQRHGASWMPGRNICVGTATIAICRATSTVRRSTGLSVRSRRGISVKNI